MKRDTHRGKNRQRLIGIYNIRKNIYIIERERKRERARERERERERKREKERERE